MKKLIWGVVLFIMGCLSLAGSATTNNHDGDIFALLMLIVGGTLAYFGFQHVRRSKETAALAIQMLREDGKLDTGTLAQRMGISEVDIRVYVAEAQRKGVIPFKVEIV